MQIGLFDLDLWYSKRRYPNLELMKTYNYYYKNNHNVIMMTPNTDEGRFDKIIYFKDKPGMDIPIEIDMCGPNKIRFGFGFYGKDELLPDEIQKTPPTFLPYDLYSERLYIKDYEYLRKRSIVRITTNDFTGLNEYKIVYVVDRAPAQLPNLIEIFEKYKKYNFQFLNPFKVYSEDELEKYRPYFKQINNRISLDFKFSASLYAAYCDEIHSFTFNITKREDETKESYIERLIKMTLLLKKKKCQNNLSFLYTDDFTQAVKKWSLNPTQQSFQEFYTGQPEENFVITSPARLRVLLKKKPLLVKSQELDFWS